MGTITVDTTIVEFDDRLLAHLQVVIVRKFRLHEGFLMSWLDPLAIGDGRSSIWLTPNATLHFKFVGSRVPTLDHVWLERLAESASSGSGLIVMQEDGTLAHAMNHRELRPAH
jgi:hypothetical protein